jgi:hypothetical protein
MLKPLTTCTVHTAVLGCVEDTQPTSLSRLFVRLLVSYLIKLIAWKFVGVRMFYELEPRSECAKWLAPPLRSSTQPTSLVQMLTVR